MYLRFSNLNSIHWIIKKDISLYVLFRTFQVNFQDISVTHIRCVGKARIEALKGKIFNLMKITKITKCTRVPVRLWVKLI